MPPTTAGKGRKAATRKTPARKAAKKAAPRKAATRKAPARKAKRKVKEGHGRRRLLTTTDVRDKFLAAMRAGNYAKVAAAHAGISESSLYGWLQRGRTERQRMLDLGEEYVVDPVEVPYVDFLESVEKADADAEVVAVAYLRKAMPENPRAVIDYLERRHPERWSRHERHELSGPGGGPVQVSRAMTSEELREALEFVAASPSLQAVILQRAALGDGIVDVEAEEVE